MINAIKKYHQRIVTGGIVLGMLCILAVLLNAPVGLLLVSSLSFGGAALVALLNDIPRIQQSSGPRLPAYAFAVFLIFLGFCGPLYLLVIFLRIFGAS